MTEEARQGSDPSRYAREQAALCVINHRAGKIDEAIANGAAAVLAAPFDMEIRYQVRSALASGIEGFHAPMLHDGARNRCYLEAIEQAVSPGARVLEIGAGSGLLAMAAARAGGEVVTCEANATLAALATMIVASNGLSEQVTVLPCRSTAIQLGQHLPLRADVLVHEIFSDNLFGEGVVQSVRDARERLINEDAVVIPPRAEIRCALAELGPALREAPLGQVEGFDLSLFEMVRPPMGQRLFVGTKALRRSDSVSLLSLDFTNRTTFGPDRESATITATGGRVDAIVQWMRIGFDTGRQLENDPFADDKSHWGAPVHQLVEPIEFEAGQPVTISARRLGWGLAMAIAS